MLRRFVIPVLSTLLCGTIGVAAGFADTASQTGDCRPIIGGAGYSCPWGVQQTLEGSPGSTGGGSIGAVGKPTPRVVYVDDVVD
ncbi:MAG: hypothetical protein V7605_856, partial [Acidimicrobiaceae bacterium]